MTRWLQHLLGLDTQNGTPYLFWSGIFADGPILGVAAVMWRRHVCHARGCFRLALHPVAGTPYVTCRRHHPDLDDRSATAEQIAEHARQAMR